MDNLTDIKFKVLIVEDDQDLGTTIAEFLSMKGVVNDICFEPSEALERLKKTSYLAVLSDINMPRMTGLEFLREVRRQGVDVPFVFLTGNGDQASIKEALKLGAIDFLDKPCNLGVVYDVVCRAMEIGNRQLKIKHAVTAEEAKKDSEIIQKLRLKGL